MGAGSAHPTDEFRLAASADGQEKGDGQLEFGGWLWRYDLVPLGPSETEVTLTYDWSAVPRYIRDRGVLVVVIHCR